MAVVVSLAMKYEAMEFLKCGAAWIPKRFCLGSLGKETPISPVVKIVEFVAVGVVARGEGWELLDVARRARNSISSAGGDGTEAVAAFARLEFLVTSGRGWSILVVGLDLS